MSYFRSYFEKNNTILKDSHVNTAKNPNTELFYGKGFSRFLFKIDLTELENRIDDGEYVLNGNTKHTLHLTNTIFGDEALLGVDRGNAKKRASSFDLIIFKINEYWDEGLGFDYDRTYDLTTGEALYDIRPSNWFYRTTLNRWSEEGVYSGTTPTIIETIHFDLGNEDINIDVTNYINGVLSGNTDYGLGLSFGVPYQDIKLDIEQSVSFFSKYTQTFFEPYLESYFDDRIGDDRSNFVVGTTQKLYLYVTKGTNFYDLDNIPSVDILDPSKTPIVGLTGLTPTKIKKGIYSVEFQITGVTNCDGKKFFYDQWKNLTLDGVNIDDVYQKFVLKPYISQYTIGENQTELQRYSIQFFGVKLNEKIKRGEKKKIVVTFRSIDYPKTVLFDEVYYRIFIKEGRTQVNVFEWTQLDKTNENSFYLDTSYMIPREYILEIKGKTHTEEIFYKNEINFEVVSEK